MSAAHWLVLLSVFMSLTGGIAYIRDTLAGKTKPNRVTWFLWAFAPLVGTGAALSAGADAWATARIFMAGFVPLLIFLASFLNPKSYWKLTMFDLLCGVCSLLAFVVWLGIDTPRLAILLAAVGDGFAALPTLVKAWRHPETETGLVYITSCISVLLIIPSIPIWNIENSAFQIYLLLVNGSMIVAVYRHRLMRFLSPMKTA
ncbi:hypothetical protein HY374_03390 [Candidatus Berkelbacteria bacterium]|nr:hypothetical protein [Candidatus Berkelbacteria bacterium]